MHEIEVKVNEICKIKDDLLAALRAEMANGLQCMNVCETGQVVDMIKDLAEAEKCCWEACYYKSVSEAMEEHDEEYDENDRSGYNNRRYSSGRYAPAGRGHISGYPMRDKRPNEMYDPMGTIDDMMPMGYKYSQAHMPGEISREMNNARHDFGMNYDNYKTARKHYTESKSVHDRDQMNMHAKNHVAEAVNSIEDIWKNSDDIELKKKIKADLSAAVNSMTV